MNYLELNKTFKELFLKHPFVNHYYTDIWKVDSDKRNVCYPAVIVTSNYVQVGSNLTTANLNIMYVDRMTREKDNIASVQSIGIDAITECINGLKQNYYFVTDENYQFTPFKEQFADMCAGVYCTVNFSYKSNIGDCSYFDPCNVDIC